MKYVIKQCVLQCGLNNKTKTVFLFSFFNKTSQYSYLTIRQIKGVRALEKKTEVTWKRDKNLCNN